VGYSTLSDIDSRNPSFSHHIVRERGLNLVVRSVGESIRTGRVRLRHADEPRNARQSVTLLDALAEFSFDASIGGARRDESSQNNQKRSNKLSIKTDIALWTAPC